MRYPMEYWTEDLRRWLGLSGVFMLLTTMIIVAEIRGDLYFEIIAILFLLLVVFRRVLRVEIPDNAMVVRRGEVLELCLKGEERMLWDRRSRAARIVLIPNRGLIDRPYYATFISPSIGYRLCICTIAIRMGHIMHRNAWQRFYNKFVTENNDGPDAIRCALNDAIRELKRFPIKVASDGDVRRHIIPSVVSRLNGELRPYGLHVAGVEVSHAIKTTTAIPSE